MKKQKQTPKEERIKCEKCKSSFGYPRLKKKEWQCRSCGHTQKMEEKQ